MADDFGSAAAQIVIRDLEENLIQAGREYEDAQRANDPTSAAYALQRYNSTQLEYEKLTGANQPQQAQLSNAQANFLSRRQALGDELSPARMQDYARGHDRALAAGWQVDSPQYFAAVAGHVDNLGDGRQAPLNEKTAAELCGISPEEYAANASRLRSLKQRGFYQD